MTFTRVPPRESAVDACARAVREAILRGDLQPGERLPPERDLAERLGVARLTLRAGLAKVAAAGLVAARQGSGYVVQDFRERGGPDLVPALLDAAGPSQVVSAVTELLGVRRAMARVLLERLAASAGAAGLAAVEAAVDALDQLVRDGAGLDELAAADLAVIRALIDAAGSSTLALCLNPIIAVLSELPELKAAVYADPRANVRGYRTLVTWLGLAPPVRHKGVDQIVAVLAGLDAAALARLPGAARSRGARRRS